METLLKVVTVFGIAVVELWAAVPAGLALQLPHVLIGAASAAGAIAGAGLTLLLGQGVREWLLRRLGRAGRREGYIQRVWTRYGVAGLGLLSPLLFRAPLGTAVGVTLGAPPSRLFGWMATGIVLWTILLLAGAEFGLAGIDALQR